MTMPHTGQGFRLGLVLPRPGLPCRPARIKTPMQWILERSAYLRGLTDQARPFAMIGALLVVTAIILLTMAVIGSIRGRNEAVRPAVAAILLLTAVIPLALVYPIQSETRQGAAATGATAPVMVVSDGRSDQNLG